MSSVALVRLRRRDGGEFVLPDAPDPPASVPFVQDSFTDIEGVQLDAHEGEIGAAWTRATANASRMQISSNRARGDGVGTVSCEASGVASSPDYYVETQLYFATTDSANDPDVRLRFRYSQTESTGYELLYNAGNSHVQLVRRDNGVADFNVIDSGALGPVAGETLPLRVECRNSDATTVEIKAYFDNALLWTHSEQPTNSKLLQAGLIGITCGKGVVSDTQGIHFDSIIAEEL